MKINHVKDWIFGVCKASKKWAYAEGGARTHAAFDEAGIKTTFFDPAIYMLAQVSKMQHKTSEYVALWWVKDLVIISILCHTATTEFTAWNKIDKITTSNLVVVRFEKMLIHQKQFVNFHIVFQLVF